MKDRFECIVYKDKIIIKDTKDTTETEVGIDEACDLFKFLCNGDKVLDQLNYTGIAKILTTKDVDTDVDVKGNVLDYSRLRLGISEIHYSGLKNLTILPFTMKNSYIEIHTTGCVYDFSAYRDNNIDTLSLYNTNKICFPKESYLHIKSLVVFTETSTYTGKVDTVESLQISSTNSKYKQLVKRIGNLRRIFSARISMGSPMSEFKLPKNTTVGTLHFKLGFKVKKLEIDLDGLTETKSITFELVYFADGFPVVFKNIGDVDFITYGRIIQNIHCRTNGVALYIEVPYNLRDKTGHENGLMRLT